MHTCEAVTACEACHDLHLRLRPKENGGPTVRVGFAGWRTVMVRVEVLLEVRSFEDSI